MGRMDRYKSDEVIPKRSEKNKVLYRQIYNAYDEFENLIVPSNSREIDLTELKKEISTREDYHDRKAYDDITSNKRDEVEIDAPKKGEVSPSKEEIDDAVYDINQLLDKAVLENAEKKPTESTLSNEEYLKKLKLDNYMMKAEKIDNHDEEDVEIPQEEEAALLKTANLSLEILSDLKSDNDSTRVSAPIKDEEIPTEEKETDFYSDNYKFSKKDFEDKEYEEVEDDEEEEDDIVKKKEKGNESGKFFFRIVLFIFGILLAILVLLYFIHYFNRV